MHTRILTQLALAISLALATACGGAQKHVESQDFTEKGWSGPSSDGATAKADPPIQSAAGAKTDEPKALVAEKTAAPAEKPETSSAAEADIVSGAALPPPPKAAKPAKAKKPGKTRKKASQAARG